MVRQKNTNKLVEDWNRRKGPENVELLSHKILLRSVINKEDHRRTEKHIQEYVKRFKASVHQFCSSDILSGDLRDGPDNSAKESIIDICKKQYKASG